jgi:hypothetical protein
LNCNICKKPSSVEGVCGKCQSRLRNHLSEIPSLQVEASQYLEPSKTGSGSASVERSIGINVSALDYSMAKELLAILHGWEAIIREARNLQPPAFVKQEESTEAEVEATCRFHLAHLDWSLGQDWASDFAAEVAEIHAKGMAATKQFIEQPRRIPCPTDDCQKFVVIDAQRIHENGLSEEVTCFGCKQSWTIIRLVTLAINNPSRRFYLDIEALGLWLQLSERQVRNIIKANDIPRKGNLYSVMDVIKAR